MLANKYATRSFIALLGAALFVLFALGAFASYRAQLLREFSHMVTSGLSAYTDSQASEINDRVDRMQRAADTIAAVLSVSEPLDEARIAQVFEQEQATESVFAMQYLPAAQLAPLFPEEASHARVLEELQRGESVMSGMTDQTGAISFSALAPVLQYGRLLGAVHYHLDVERLTRTLHQGLLSTSVYSYIVDGSGTLLLPPSDSPADALYARLRAQTPGENQALAQAIEQGSSYALQCRTHDSLPLFAATVPLTHNGWRLLDLSDGNNIQTYFYNILRHTMLVCLLFGLCTIVIIALVYYIHKRQQRRLRLSELRYDLLARFSDTLLFEYYFSSDTMIWSGNASKALELASTRITNYERDGHDAALVHPDDLAMVRAKRHELLENDVMGCYEARLRLSQGEYRWYSCQFQMICEKGEPRLLFDKLTDISTHKAREARLLARAESDSLTGLLNNGSLRDETEKRLREGASGFFFVFDVDNFKSVNDDLGHIVGDSALRAIAEVLQGSFRERDLIGRWGGDEFAAFMDGTEDMAAAARKAHELVVQISAVQLKEAPALRLSASIGVARAQSGTTDIRALYDAADRAMYIAKRKGKNSYHIEVL